MATEKRQPLVIGFEGNIGAGKTTLIRALAKRLEEEGFVFWDTALQCPHLEKFYADRSAENAFLVQKWVADERAERSYPMEVPIILVDRTTMSDVVFTMLSADLMGKEKTLQLLDAACANTQRELIDVTFFIDTPVETCLENIGKRGRPMETGIDKAYLERIDAGYRRVFEKLTRSDDPIVFKVPFREADQAVDIIWVALQPFLIGDATAEETGSALQCTFKD